jgi:hypothetical protein
MLFEIAAQTNSSNPLPQFLFPAFSKGMVKMKMGTSYSAVLNYNMVDEEFLFKQKDVYMTLDKPEEIDTISIQGRKFVPVNKVFYEVVVKGKISIYIQQKSHYAPVGSQSAYGITSQTNGPTAVSIVRGGNQVRYLEIPDNVTISSESVNWISINGTLNKFTNGRQFLKNFPEYEDQLKEFIKQNKIDFKVREDLLKLGNYCNELIK